MPESPTSGIDDKTGLDDIVQSFFFSLKEPVGDWIMDGEPGLNWLCAGLKAFFAHTLGPMQIMATLLRQGIYADEIMGMLDENGKLKRNLTAPVTKIPQQKIFSTSMPKDGRNDPCPCGVKDLHGKPIKYKKCHGLNAEVVIQ